MKITIDTKDMTADEFGEFFRNYFFTKGKGFGCYANFEVEPFMMETALSPQKVREHFGEIDSKPYYFVQRDNLSIWMAYHWDGDGTLVVSDGERICINNDCKKSYGWEFIEQ